MASVATRVAKTPFPLLRGGDRSPPSRTACTTDAPPPMLDTKEPAVPKRGKLTKQTRARKMIAGIRKHAAAIDAQRIGPGRLGAAALVARFEAHLECIDDIAKYDALKSDAVAREAKLEVEMLALWHLVRYFAASYFGEESVQLRDFGLKERKKPVISSATKALAVAKRRATRAVRRTMGKRQRRKIKGSI